MDLKSGRQIYPSGLLHFANLWEDPTDDWNADDYSPTPAETLYARTEPADGWSSLSCSQEHSPWSGWRSIASSYRTADAQPHIVRDFAKMWQCNRKHHAAQKSEPTRPSETIENTVDLSEFVEQM